MPAHSLPDVIGFLRDFKKFTSKEIYRSLWRIFGGSLLQMLEFVQLNLVLKIKDLFLALMTLLVTFALTSASLFTVVSAAHAEEWICADGGEWICANTSSAVAEASQSLPTTLIPSVTNAKYSSLAGKFLSGNFELYDLGTYVQYLIETLIYFAGGIAVLFIVIGGYKYMIGGISDDKEAGKKTIMYALSGFVVTILAWTIVNATQVFVTKGDGKVAPVSSEQWVCGDSEQWVCAD